MKQRRKILLALLLSASVAATPIASAVPAFAEDPDFTASAEFTDTPEEETSVTEDLDSANAFNAGEVEYTAADEASAQADTETRTHSIKVSVINSKGEVSGMYAMDNAVVTRQDDGTYLVRMHQTSVNRNYMALTNDTTAATNHEVDWYVAGGADGYWYTIPVANLNDPVHACFSYTKNVNAGKKWGNPQTITFDVSSMAETTESDAVASDIHKLPNPNGPADYTAVDAALAKVPADLSIYTDETAAAVTAAVNAVKRDCTLSQQADVDKMAADINAAVEALVEKGVLEVSNQTLMFNVEKAILRKDESGSKLIITLHGQGYHYLYKGTYEQAVANGDKRENWIAGEQVNGLWQFTIPVSEGEDYIPVVAISNSYLTKYEQGKNTLERAFYPRQLKINEAEMSLTSGDYDHVKDLTVSNSVKMFKVNAASLHTIGGPNSNNYQEILHLTMGSDSFDKIFIGSADDAAKAETTTAITDRKADLVVKANTMGGGTITDYLDKEVILSFHSVKNDSWYERVFNISNGNNTLTITPVPVPATEIILDTSSQTLDTGKSFKLTATVTPSDTTDNVVWTSSNSKVATVSENGTVTAVKEGTAVITAKAGNVEATCTVTVKKAVVKVTKVAVSATPSRNVAAGKKVQLKATVTPSKATNKAVTWKSSNTKYATVNSKGLVTFKKNAGGKTVTITATAKDGSKKYGKVTLTCMKGSVKRIKLSGTTTIKAGKSTTLKAKVSTQNGKANTKLTWTSSNTKIATVNSKGKVTAVKGKKGTVKITAKATDGSRKTATITIKVK